MDPINFLVVELATLGYCLAASYHILESWETTPGHLGIVAVLLAAFVLHARRFALHYTTILQWGDVCPNAALAGALAGLLWVAWKTRNTLLSGLLAGAVMIASYAWKQSRTGFPVKVVDCRIDGPMTLAGMAISWYALTQNKLVLFPMVGDLVYHIAELMPRST